jgi:hypothetical protein
MRDRDRWEQWLRAEITSLPLGHGVDVVTAWAVASMVATYANSDGSDITVSTDTLRKQIQIGKSKLDRTLKWLEEVGVLTVTAKHGRGTPTRRALVIPAAGSNGTTQGGPVNSVLNGPATRLNGPLTEFERTGNPIRDPFDQAAQGGPQPVKITKEIPGGGGPHAHPREDPAAAEPPGPEPPRRCAEHADGDPGYPCIRCKDARLDWERWKRASDRRETEGPALPPECGQCDARPGDLPSARMINAGSLCLKCPRCHPESLALRQPSTNDHGIRRSD